MGMVLGAWSSVNILLSLVGLVSAKHETPEHGFHIIKRKKFILREIMVWSIVDRLDNGLLC